MGNKQENPTRNNPTISQSQLVSAHSLSAFLSPGARSVLVSGVGEWLLRCFQVPSDSLYSLSSKYKKLPFRLFFPHTCFLSLLPCRSQRQGTSPCSLWCCPFLHQLFSARCAEEYKNSKGQIGGIFYMALRLWFLLASERITSSSSKETEF